MAGSDNRAFAWMRAVRDSDLESTTKHVLLTLGTRMDPNGGNCYPSIRTLCADTSLSNKSVIRHLGEAEQEGWIERREAGRSGQGWRRNCYLPRTPKGGERVTPRSPQGGEATTPPSGEGGEPLSEKVVNEVHTTSSITSSETTHGGERGEADSASYPPPSDLPKDDAGRYVYPDAFESTWTVYPTRDGSNPKKAAYRKWRARVQNGAAADQLHEATEALARRMDAEGTAGTRYVMQATKFFGPDDYWREELDRDAPDPVDPSRDRRAALDAIDQGGRGG